MVFISEQNLFWIKLILNGTYLIDLNGTYLIDWSVSNLIDWSEDMLRLRLGSSSSSVLPSNQRFKLYQPKSKLDQFEDIFIESQADRYVTI